MKLTHLNSIILAGIIALFATLQSCQTKSVEDQPSIKENSAPLVSYVDPFIGTADHGHVYPGATVPFGMVQLSPDNGTQGWDWCSGYNWADSMIVGFSHTHLSGTGIGDLCDISFMPATGKIDFSSASEPRNSSYAAAFSHDNETAQPGYYQVSLDNGISVELTASTRVGMHQYTFPENADATILIDLGFAINWDRPIETQLHIQPDKSLVTGYRISEGWAKDQRVYFAASFSEPFNNYVLADSTSLKDQDLVEGTKVRAQLSFNDTKKVTIKVGLSTADEAGALAALNEIPGWNINNQKRKASDLWEKELSKIKIESDQTELKRIFYTSLYRTCLAPVVMSDANGKYKGLDGKVHKADGFTKYDIFSLWDTFRAANPLYTIIQKDKINDHIQSMLVHYEQYGLLPVWSLLGNETNTMTGYHAIPVIVDAYIKGFREYDVEKAYEAVKASAMQDIRGSQYYREYGYIPYDKEGQSVTKTLEYAYDDWCIAQFAKALGKDADYNQYMKRAEAYRHFFDASTGFMRAKYANGKWKVPFDPQYSSHDFSVAEYTEGNAWQHSWFVPHNPKGLIELHGGDAPFVQKLDSLFSADSEIKGDFASADISGLIGQYAHGNEPSHHIAYFYNYAGMPWKSQEKVREIMHSQYNDTPTGLCGNEDCGQMSAWYVFSAMGFYPVNPAQSVYVIGSPLFERIKIEVGPGKYFHLNAKGTSNENMYVKSVKWNGAIYDNSYITHQMIMDGGELELEMTNQPNPKWANDEGNRPPSMTLSD
jgi:predicted alpha-1,2-mannosidase